MFMTLCTFHWFSSSLLFDFQGLLHTQFLSSCVFSLFITRNVYFTKLFLDFLPLCVVRLTHMILGIKSSKSKILCSVMSILLPNNYLNKITLNILFLKNVFTNSSTSFDKILGFRMTKAGSCLHLKWSLHEVHSYLGLLHITQGRPRKGQ